MLIADEHRPARPDGADEELALGHPARLVDNERVVVDVANRLAAAADDALRRGAHEVRRAHERLAHFLDEVAGLTIDSELLPALPQLLVPGHPVALATEQAELPFDVPGVAHA